MPAIFDAKYFNAEVFGKYVDTIPKLKRTELLKSGAVVVNDRIKGMLSEQTGGNIITTPMLGLIGGKPVNYDGKTDIEDNSTKTFSHTRVVVGRANAWTEKDFSYDITGGVNFMDNVARQVAGYWDDIDQDTLLAILDGIFSMTGTENKKFVDAHTFDITKEKQENKFGVTRNLQMATVNGRTILIDDSMPVQEVTDAGGNYTAYTSYVLGKGAFELTNAGVKVPYEMDRNPKVNGGQDTLYSRQRNCFAPYGISFTNKKMVSLSPTDEELKNGLNWTLVESTDGETINHKAIPIARIVTRG